MKVKINPYSGMYIYRLMLPFKKFILTHFHTGTFLLPELLAAISKLVSFVFRKVWMTSFSCSLFTVFIVMLVFLLRSFILRPLFQREEGY